MVGATPEVSGRTGGPPPALPVMKLAAPLDGSVVQGQRIVDAIAPFYFGVSRVDFRLDGPQIHNNLIGSATVSRQYGWYFIWNTKDVPNGTYTLRSIAYGASGHHSVSAPVTIRVAN